MRHQIPEFDAAERRRPRAWRVLAWSFGGAVVAIGILRIATESWGWTWIAAVGFVCIALVGLVGLPSKGDTSGSFPET